MRAASVVLIRLIQIIEGDLSKQGWMLLVIVQE